MAEDRQAAMAQLRESAAADAKFKTALKHNADGDAAKLQTAVTAYVHAAALLRAALAGDGKENVAAALRKKLETVEARLEELQPIIRRLGVTVPTSAEAAAAARSGSSSVPSSPAAANSVADVSGERALAQRAVPKGLAAAWRKRQKAAVEGIKKAHAADSQMKANTDPSKVVDLRAEAVRLYDAAEAALRQALDASGVPADTMHTLAPKLTAVTRRADEIRRLPNPNAISWTSSDEEDEEEEGGEAAEGQRKGRFSPPSAAMAPPAAAAVNTRTSAPPRKSWKEKQDDARRKRAGDLQQGASARQAATMPRKKLTWKEKQEEARAKRTRGATMSATSSALHQPQSLQGAVLPAAGGAVDTTGAAADVTTSQGEQEVVVVVEQNERQQRAAKAQAVATQARESAAQLFEQKQKLEAEARQTADAGDRPGQEPEPEPDTGHRRVLGEACVVVASAGPTSTASTLAHGREWGTGLAEGPEDPPPTPPLTARGLAERLAAQLAQKARSHGAGLDDALQLMASEALTAARQQVVTEASDLRNLLVQQEHANATLRQNFAKEAKNWVCLRTPALLLNCPARKVPVNRSDGSSRWNATPRRSAQRLLRLCVQPRRQPAQLSKRRRARLAGPKSRWRQGGLRSRKRTRHGAIVGATAWKQSERSSVCSSRKSAARSSQLRLSSPAPAWRRLSAPSVRSESRRSAGLRWQRSSARALWRGSRRWRSRMQR